MELKELENSLQQAISGAVRLLAEGHNRFRIFTPFMFDDGDHFFHCRQAGERGVDIFRTRGILLCT